MKNLLLSIVTIALAINVCHAQSSFSGTVYSTNPKQPVGFAFIRISDSLTSLGAVTDERGEFEFTNLKAGNYQIEIQHIEYETLFSNVLVNAPTVTQNIELTRQFEYLDAALINGIRVSNTAPVTTTNLDKTDIQQADQQKDFPFLLNLTPSTVISSDAGNGVGYTGVRIRGIDPTRVNVTINGIPLNDAESQGVYWVNLPDLASSSESVQIQRGIGSSSNGGASFGASVNIRTNDLNPQKSSKVVLGTGSFGTNRISLGHNSGRLKNNWGYQLRGSIIESNGYIDRASSDLKSANLIVGKYWDKASLKANILIGSERTYQAWWGIPQPKFMGDVSETNRYISQLYISGQELENLINANSKTYNYYTYENEVDNYNQNHYQLFYDYDLNTKWKLNSAGYITTGKGYYEQFRASDDLSTYNLPMVIVNGDSFDQADVIRRRWLGNTLIGFITNAHYAGKLLNTTIGLGYSNYKGRHFGEAIATQFTGYEDLNSVYYDNDARKNELNTYVKATYKLGKWLPYLDVQLRQVSYRFEGLDNNLAFGNQNVQYTFVNPKLGISYNHKRTKAYIMLAQGNREPVRDDFRNNKPTDWPKHESLNNIELGYRYSKGRNQLRVTLYHMDYTNQLVLTGAVNDVGENVRTNVKSSYRQGVELEWQFPLSKTLQIGGNATFAQNKIESFTEYVGAWDGNYEIIETAHSNTDIAFSPNTIASIILSYKLSKAVQLDISNKYVGQQFLDNTQSDARRLDGFNNLDLAIRYQANKVTGLKGLGIGLFVNNMLNAYYAPNGYTFSGYIAGQRQDFNYVYPMAGRNVMLKASIDI